MKSALKKLASLMFTMILFSSLCVPATFAYSPLEQPEVTDIAKLVQAELLGQGTSIEEELNALLSQYRQLAMMTPMNSCATGIQRHIRNRGRMLLFETTVKTITQI